MKLRKDMINPERPEDARNVVNQRIIDAFKRGNDKVLNSFYLKNQPYVQRMIIKNNGVVEDAEDIMQEALILLYKKIKADDLALRCSIHTFFYGICKNLWRNTLRKRHRLVCFSDIFDDRLQEDPSILQLMELENQNQVYEDHFSKLNKKSKYIWELSFQGKSNTVIASALNCTTGSIRKRKFDNKNFLIQSMKKDKMYLELIA